MDRDHAELVVVLGVIFVIFLAGIVFINLNQENTANNTTKTNSSNTAQAAANVENKTLPTQNTSGSSDVVVINSGENPAAYNLSAYNTPGTYIYVQLGRTSELIITGTVVEIQPSVWNTPDGTAPEELVLMMQTQQTQMQQTQMQQTQAQQTQMPPMQTHQIPAHTKTAANTVEIDLSPDKRIYTDVVIQIDKIHKGNTESPIVIRTYAGTVDNVRFESDIEPEDFVGGKEYFLFLEKDSGPLKNTGEPHYVVSGPAGKILLLENGTGVDNNGKIVNMTDVKKSVVLKTQTISSVVVQKVKNWNSDLNTKEDSETGMS
ncbi:hypothetical protein [Methanolapillus millepedarum]|uniref:Uncharacterized protein n=1 Tax=Methanolapillus millepedarum TaxID=3028296 RepID=A0AA96ZVJ8_9EURY|nr:hypothetical protein MsAc7_10730 [Methanosarcinaceae archaeon Ac7]